MQQWAPIEVADALELLSPDFKNDEVRAHAVATLQAKDDDELLYYLLQVRLLLCGVCFAQLGTHSACVFGLYTAWRDTDACCESPGACCSCQQTYVASCHTSSCRCRCCCVGLP
jgi:hypothetical protein